MKVVLSDLQKRHGPVNYLVNGTFVPSPETPERVDLLLAGALAAGCERVAPPPCGMAPLAAVHTQDYLAFLMRAHERWSHIAGASAEVIADIRPLRRDVGYPSSVIAQAGYHMADAAAPIAASTWEAALWSAASAVHAADLVLGGDRVAYALCRPPGHHAGRDVAAGFCYLNNVAIATERLLPRFRRLAILDLDLHHGNGTQEIFYSRADVFTVSIHADPRRFYPFFTGYIDERGTGAGMGCNLNLPLERGASDEPFLAALDLALGRIAVFAPEALVVALGLDGFAGDPIAGLTLTTAGFGRIGAALAAAWDGPLLIVQEGGYPCRELIENSAAFLRNFTHL